MRPLKNFSLIIQLFLLVIAAVDAIGPVGIRSDSRLDSGSVHYTSFVGHIQTTSGPSITKEQLVTFAKKGMQEMADQYSGKNRPGVMTAISLGTHVYFASSVVGGGSKAVNFPHFKNEEVARVMKACIGANGNNDAVHRNGGRCGEFNALALFTEKNNGHLPPPGAWVVTANNRNGQIQLVDPCHDDDPKFYACKDFVHHSGLNLVPLNTPSAQEHQMPTFRHLV
jgi:hypothetical protein